MKKIHLPLLSLLAVTAFSSQASEVERHEAIVQHTGGATLSHNAAMADAYEYIEMLSKKTSFELNRMLPVHPSIDPPTLKIDDASVHIREVSFFDMTKDELIEEKKYTPIIDIRYHYYDQATPIRRIVN